MLRSVTDKPGKYRQVVKKQIVILFDYKYGVATETEID